MRIEEAIMRIALEYGPLGSATIMVAAGFGIGAALAGSAWCCVQSRADLNAAKVEALEDYIKKTRITPSEREAVAWALKEAVWSYSEDTGNHRATLRGLLERLG